MIAKRVPNERATSSPARLIKYIVNAKGGVDPREWAKTADYILDNNSEVNNKGERVGGVRVTNCGTDDPAAATVLIEATQSINTTSKKDKTYHLIFSFPPGEEPSLETLHAIEDELCASIGFADHQRISAVHIDTDHLHVHVAINKVHPTGYQNIEPYYDKRRLMVACEQLEEKYNLEKTNHGLGEKHERNRQIKLNPGVEPRDRDTRFRRHLRESNNITLTERPEAKTLDGLRNLSGCRMARLAERTQVLLQGDARSSLEQRGKEPANGLRRSGNGAGAAIGERGRNLGGQSATIEAQSGIETLAGYVSREVAADIAAATDWPGVHSALAEHGLEIAPRGAGLVIGDPGIPLWVRASQCGRELSKKGLTDRLGPYEASENKQESNKPKRKYSPKPLHTHQSTSQLFAEYQREKQQNIAKRKAGMAQIKTESTHYLAGLKKWQANQRNLLKLSAGGVIKKTMRITLKNQAAAARAKNSATNKAKRSKLVGETATPSWADWLTLQAKNGNEEALEVLRSREERQERLSGDLLTAQSADRAKAVIMKKLNPTVRRDGAVTYRTIDGGMVVDRKSHIQAQKSSTGASLVALSLASEKYSGQKLDVDGTDEFKKEVAQLAALHKLNVSFSDPGMEAMRIKVAAEVEAEKNKGSELVDYGPAPYENKKGNRESYFATVKTAAGEKTFWGVDLERAIKGSGANKGDSIHLERVAATPVTLPSGEIAQRNQWELKIASKSNEGSEKVPLSVEKWIKNRNFTRDKISSLGYHRVWKPTDAGKAIYQGRRKMPDGKEVLLLGRGNEVLVKPSSPNVVAKASKWKIGSAVTLDKRGRFINNSKVHER